MRRLLAGVAGLLIGYVVLAFAGYWIIQFYSDNHFDRSVEASMTAAFVFGPIGAIVGLVVGVIYGRLQRRD